MTVLSPDLDATSLLDDVVSALVATQDRLAALTGLTRLSATSSDLDDLLDRALDQALELTDSDAVRLMLPNAMERIRTTRSDDQLRVRRQLSEQPMADTVMLPLSDDVGGSVCIARTGSPYDTGDVRMLETVVAALDQLLRLDRLHRDGVSRARVQREHQLASELAHAALAWSTPQVDGVELFTSCRPADLAGGDLLVVEKVGSTVWFAVGDVAGKGLPAAMVMTRAVAAVRVAFLTAADPVGAVQAIGAELGSYLSSVGSFLTLLVGRYRIGAEEVALCNAGHSPVLVCEAGRARAVRPSRPPIGIEVGCGRVDWVPLTAGSLLLVGTDGLAEQPDPAGRQLGYPAFEAICAELAGSAAADAAITLLAEVQAHAAGQPAGDDQTLLVLGTGAGR